MYRDGRHRCWVPEDLWETSPLGGIALREGVPTSWRDLLVTGTDRVIRRKAYSHSILFLERRIVAGDDVNFANLQDAIGMRAIHVHDLAEYPNWQEELTAFITPVMTSITIQDGKVLDKSFWPYYWVRAMGMTSPAPLQQFALLGIGSRSPADVIFTSLSRTMRLNPHADDHEVELLICADVLFGVPPETSAAFRAMT